MFLDPTSDCRALPMMMPEMSEATPSGSTSLNAFTRRSWQTARGTDNTCYGKSQSSPSHGPHAGKKLGSRRFTEAVACSGSGTSRDCAGYRGRAGVASLATRAVSKHADITPSASTGYIIDSPADRQRSSGSSTSDGITQCRSRPDGHHHRGSC